MSFEPKKSRGEKKSAEELLQEEKAKGHRGPNGGKAEEEPGEMVERKERGNQKGIGRNQGNETKDRYTAHGRAHGADHG